MKHTQVVYCVEYPTTLNIYIYIYIYYHLQTKALVKVDYNLCRSLGCVCVEGDPPPWDRAVPWWAGRWVTGK